MAFSLERLSSNFVLIFTCKLKFGSKLIGWLESSNALKLGELVRIEKFWVRRNLLRSFFEL